MRLLIHFSIIFFISAGICKNKAFSCNSLGEKRWIVFYAEDWGTLSSPAGHAFVSFVKEDNSLQQTIVECWGFYPQNGIGLFGDVDSAIKNDLGRQINEGFAVEVTEIDYQKCIASKNIWDSKKYNLIAQNCVSFIDDIAKQICNLKTPYSTTLVIPIDYIKELKSINKNYYKCGGASTLFLFDLSGSMNERMPSGVSRIEEAKAAAKATLRTMGNATNQGVSQEIDIRGFSGACVSDPTFPITNGFATDFSAVENAVNRIPIPNGGTPLFEAIQSSRQKLLQRLDQTGAKQAKLIILSDGQATCTPIRPADVYAFGQYGQTTQNISTSGNPLLSSNLRYYAVGFGIDPGSPAERDLQYLAQISGGKYLNAQNQFELTRAFQKFNKIFVPKPAPALVDVPATSRDVFDRGVSTIYAEEYETALERCKTYVQQHPEDCHGIYNFALMQEANEYYKSAIASFEKYLQLCPGADDGIHVRKQIADLKQDYEAFLIFNRKVIMSDMEYLDLHFKKIQNGQSVALAQEFIAFIKEKYSYYQNLPAILEINNRAFDSASKEVFRGLSSCIETIKRNSQTWDRDATPVLSKTYITMERLLQTF